MADGRHSVPTTLVIRNGDGERRVVPLDVPADHATPERDRATTAGRFPALTGSRFRVTIAKVRPVLTREYDCGCDVETPASIAELGVPNLAAVIPPASMPSTCRNDLLIVDGPPVPVQLVGHHGRRRRAAAARRSRRVPQPEHACRGALDAAAAT